MARFVDHTGRPYRNGAWQWLLGSLAVAAVGIVSLSAVAASDQVHRPPLVSAMHVQQSTTTTLPGAPTTTPATAAPAIPTEQASNGGTTPTTAPVVSPTNRSESATTLPSTSTTTTPRHGDDGGTTSFGDDGATQSTGQRNDDGGDN